MKLIQPDNKCFSYMGRIDFKNPEKPVFIYAGSMVKIRFTGDSVAVRIRNIPMCERYPVGAIIDGVQYKIELNSSEEKLYPIASFLEGEKGTVHELTIFKRLAAYHYFEFDGIAIEDGGEVFPFEHKYDLKLDIYGDSVSAGESVEAIYYEAHSDPKNHQSVYDNAWFSYANSLARKLNAEIYNNSQGGLPLFDKTGYFNGPNNLTGLETTYNKLSYADYSPLGLSDWDFSKYTPDYVIIAIGQNDASPDPDCLRKPEYKEKWKNKYKEIVRDLDGKYKTAKFILITTVLCHDPIWDDTIDEIANELGVLRYRFIRNGAATPGHPRITEQEEMAGELAEFIRRDRA